MSAEWSQFIALARRATLATVDPDGTPALVPICFAVVDGAIVSPLDEKPKRSQDPRMLRRVRNLLADPRATLLIDRWDEDWTRLAFVHLAVTGAVVEPGADGHRAAVTALREKYPQYRTQRIEERPVLWFAIERAGAWSGVP